MTDDADDTAENAENTDTLGAFIRAQRKLANLSVRQLSTMAEISNAYLSQIERNLHEPSIRVLKNVGDALGIAPEKLMSQAGLIGDDTEGGVTTVHTSTEDAILADPYLEEAEKQALLSVYLSYRTSKT